MWIRKNSYGDFDYFQYKELISEITSGDAYKYCADLEYMPASAALDWDNDVITTIDEEEHELEACTAIALTASISGSTLTITRAASTAVWVNRVKDQSAWSEGMEILQQESAGTSDITITLRHTEELLIYGVGYADPNLTFTNFITIRGGSTAMTFAPDRFATFRLREEDPTAAPFRTGEMQYNSTDEKLFMSVETDAVGDWVQLPVLSKTVDFVTGTAAPSATPEKVGQMYIDTTNSKVYVSKGTSSSADWLALN